MKILIKDFFPFSVNARNRNSIIECVITAIPGNKNMVQLFVEMEGEYTYL